MMNVSLRLFVLISALVLSSCGVFHHGTKSSSDRKKLDNTALFIEGIHLKMVGKYDDAMLLFKMIAKDDSRHSASRYEIARLYAEKRDYEQAIVYARQAVNIEPENKWYSLLLVDIYDKTGDIKNKISIYSQLLKIYPEDMTLYYGLSNTYFQDGDLKSAVKVLNDLESQIGVTEEVSIQKYSMYVSMKNNEGALEELKKLIIAFPGDNAYKMAVGDYFLQTGNYYEALTHYSAIFDADPADYEALISMAECYMRIGNTSKATELFAIIFQDSAVEVDAKMNIILYYYEVSEKDSALLAQSYTLLEIYENVHPEDPKVFSVYGDFLFRDKRYDEAFKKWEKVIVLDPSKYTVWEHMFFSIEQMKDWQNLKQTAEKSLEYFPEQAAGHLFLGVALFMQKQYELCIEPLQTAISLSDEKDYTVTAMNNLGQAYHFLGRHEESDKMFDSLLIIDSRNVMVLNNYAFYLGLRGEHLEKALDMSARAAKYQPKNPAVLDTYGWILFLLKRYDESETILEKAVELLNEPNPTIYRNYGDVLYQQNKKDEAIIWWQKAIDSGGDAEEILKRIQQINNE